MYRRVLLLQSIRTAGGNFLCKFVQEGEGSSYAYVNPEGVILRRVDEHEWSWALSTWTDSNPETLLTIVALKDVEMSEEEEEEALDLEEEFFLKCEALEKKLLRQVASRGKR